jgi:hypothetical protein
MTAIPLTKEVIKKSELRHEYVLEWENWMSVLNI